MTHINTKLIDTCVDYSISIARKYLEEGADINCKNYFDRTPLILACSHARDYTL